MNRKLASALFGLDRAIRNVLARAVVSLVDDVKRLQEVQVDVLDGETRDGVERFQNYGFTSRPHEGAEAIIVYLNGSRDQGVAVAIDDRRYRIRNLQPGEVAIYTDEGDKIHIKRGGTIEVTASTKVKLICPEVEIAGDLLVTGDISVPTGDVTAGSISLKTHVHGGVQAGGGVTGAPQ